jgi:hypothetical protein
MTMNISMPAINLPRGSFQVCAVGPDATVLYNRVPSRTMMAALEAEQSPCVVAMEACAAVVDHPIGKASFPKNSTERRLSGQITNTAFV